MAGVTENVFSYSEALHGNVAQNLREALPSLKWKFARGTELQMPCLIKSGCRSHKIHRNENMIAF